MEPSGTYLKHVGPVLTTEVAGSWNPSQWLRRSSLSCIDHNMAADVLKSQGINSHGTNLVCIEYSSRSTTPVKGYLTIYVLNFSEGT